MNGIHMSVKKIQQNVKSKLLNHQKNVSYETFPNVTILPKFM